jgi:predicted MFS family arabinose efflux permease
MGSRVSPVVSPVFQGLAVAVVLSLGAAVSLGITRFAYGLLLPPMRADLGWSYTLAGAMNTANAAGYLVGALSAPWLMRRAGVPRVLVGMSLLASVFMAGSGFFTHATPLLAQRLLAGVTSAWVFVACGLLAARLGQWYPTRSGLMLGVVYGGVGWGIVLSALAVPGVLAAHSHEPHGWAWAWWWLALACVLATAALVWPAHFFKQKESPALDGIGSSATKKVRIPATVLPPQPPADTHTTGHWVRRLAFAMAGYACFGVGYISYMTFVIALLRDQGVAPADITLFYALLGAAVVASGRLWAGLLDRAKGGGALALLNALLGVATVLPAVTTAWPLLLLSGVMFGGVFLSVVASTTALVRHNLPVAQWPAGISAFTIVFAVGQIFGPSAVGWIADGPGGLARGLLCSALALWLGALLAWRQKPLAVPA